MSLGRIFAGAALCAALGGISFPITALNAAADKVQIEVTGNLVPSCGNSSTTLSLDAGDLTKAGSAKFAFTVDCNAPFQYTMQSQNGALRLVNAPAAASAASTEVPYDVHIRIPLTPAGAIDDTCNSASLKQGAISCKFTDSGREIAVNQTVMGQLDWKAGQQLAAGKYQDQLVISISARL